MERSILIHFDTNTGEFQIEAEGFEGGTCIAATQPFEEALGIVKESDRTYKPEAEIRLTTRSTQNHSQYLEQ